MKAEDWRPIAEAEAFKQDVHIWDQVELLLWTKYGAVTGRWDTDAMAKKPRPYWTYGNRSMRARAFQPTHFQEIVGPAAEVMS